MNKAVNKIIAEKLDGLDALPEGYHPNIASKWTLIEESLDERKSDRRSHFFILLRIAAIVLIVLISAGIWFHFNTSKKNDVAERETQFVFPHEIVMPVVLLNKLNDTQMKSKHFEKNALRKTEPQNPTDIKIDQVATEPILSENVSNTEIIKPKQRKQRYVQVDFNDNVQSMAHVQSSEPFKFKLGIGRRLGKDENGKSSPSLKISKTF